MGVTSAAPTCTAACGSRWPCRPRRPPCRRCSCSASWSATTSAAPRQGRSHAPTACVPHAQQAWGRSC